MQFVLNIKCDGTGERCETTAHGSDWHPRVWTAIANEVG